MADQRRLVQDSLDEAMQHHFDGASDSPNDFNILVTGFGPFKKQYPINPSYEIAARLPTSISIPNSNRKINLLVHQPAMRVSYDVVRLLTPYLYEGRRVDFTLHIGMAGSRDYYSIESKAHKRGYKSPDVDGDLCSYASDGRNKAEELLQAPEVKDATNEFGDKTLASYDFTDEVEQSKGAQVAEDWTPLPEVLESDIDVHRVLRHWDDHLKHKADVRISNDAGRYLCEFIYWCSLAHRELQSDIGMEVEKRGQVLFLHVPGEADGVTIEKGVEVTVALLKAIAEEAEDERERGKKIEFAVDGTSERKDDPSKNGDEDHDSDDYDMCSNTEGDDDKAGGEILEDDKDMKAEASQKGGDRTVWKTGGRGPKRKHTKRDASKRYDGMVKRQKEKKKLANELPVAPQLEMTLKKEAPEKEEQESTDVGKEKVEVKSAVAEDGGTVVDKRYEGYVMEMPADEPFSN